MPFKGGKSREKSLRNTITLYGTEKLECRASKHKRGGKGNEKRRKNAAERKETVLDKWLPVLNGFENEDEMRARSRRENKRGLG